jgi:hypothetical protein
MLGDRIEQRSRLRAEGPLAGTTLVIRGGRDSPDKLRSHVQRTARAWSLDGKPLLGISVFAVLGEPLGSLRSALSTCPLPASLLITDLSCCPPGSVRISPCAYGVQTIRN